MAKDKSSTDGTMTTCFVVLNNPADHGYPGSPGDACKRFVDDWLQDSPTRTGACTYCISADGLHHLHAVLEDIRSFRFSQLKKLYPSAHLEVTKGTREQAEAYINKLPPYEEKGEEVLALCQHGEIKGCQGRRTDIEEIQSYIDAGMKPRTIMALNLSYRRMEKLIRSAYMDKRYRETPTARDVVVHYHVGPSGSGKSFERVRLCELYGESEVYLLNDNPRTGGMDFYEAERILFWDELKPDTVSYHDFLIMTDCYKAQIHCRYANTFALYDEVHITSVYPPEELYNGMVLPYLRKQDPIDQMYRRITDVTYHEKSKGEYLKFTIPMAEYCGYRELVNAAHSFWDSQSCD